MKLKDCTKCDGYGWVEGFKIAPTPNGPEEIPTRDECEVCNGSGEISGEEKQTEDVIKNIQKGFREVTYQFDALREANVLDMSEAFMELETALINFDMDLDSFLQEIKEEK